ncbi:MAG: hypothetical protein L0Y55_00740 [Anaerolineales bacterium]|nr:hypothetical protein [Anaerolineales bacterium]
MFDISPVMPQARAIVEQAAQIYFDHTRPWFIGLIIHGSALKGGFIPGCSDIDFRLYLRDDAFQSNGALRFDLSLAIHRDLAQIDPAPFQYIQCYAQPPRLTTATNTGGDIGPFPGTYHILLGKVPVPEPTADQVRERARESLATLQTIPAHLANGLLDHGGGRLERHVRLLCTEVWPTLFNVLTLRAADPLAVWKLSKLAAIELLPADESPGKEIRAFHRAVLDYYSRSSSVEHALEIIERGVAFLQAAQTTGGKMYDNDDVS